MFKFPLLASAALMALPAMAETTTPRPLPALFLRDSDGIVISVIDPIDGIPGGGGVLPGGVYYTLGGDGGELSGIESLGQGGTSGLPRTTVLIGGGELLAPDMAGQILRIAGGDYRIEVSGDEVWLRDMETGARLAATRHVAPDAQGLSVNPATFALE